MGQRQSVSAQMVPDLSESIFQLRKSNSTSSTMIHVDFSAVSVGEPGKASSMKTLPMFNTDQRHYTPAFILEVDNQRYIDNQQIYLNIHNRKTSQMQQQKTQIFVPKPSKNNSYCCICRTPFDDYLTHVSLPKHRLIMKQSDYCLRIEEICSSYQRKDEPLVIPPKKKRGRPAKTKLICKMPSSKSLSGKETSGEESLKAQELVAQTMA